MSVCPVRVGKYLEVKIFLSAEKRSHSVGGQRSNMDIEEYARKHRHFWNSARGPVELKFILDNNSFKTLIDIGCGDGALLHHLEFKGYLAQMEVWGGRSLRDQIKFGEKK